MPVKVIVEIDNLVVFSLASGGGSEGMSNTMCSQDDLPTVKKAIANSLKFCDIDSSRFDNPDGVGDICGSPSEINRDVPVSVMRDNE